MAQLVSGILGGADLAQGEEMVALIYTSQSHGSRLGTSLASMLV